MTNQQLTRRVFELIRNDPQLVGELETMLSRRRFILLRWWSALWFPFYLTVGLWAMAGTIKALFRWTGVR